MKQSNVSHARNQAFGRSSRPSLLARSRSRTVSAFAELDASRRRVLVLNAGSSSLKFKTFEMSSGGGGSAAPTLLPGMGGIFERIGDEANSGLVAKGINASGQPQKWDMKVPARSARMHVHA